jgi:formiminotetrahydrofolate cyclodeaminase
MASDLLQLTVDKLLDEFGAGQDTPGSGSAAALMGLTACALTKTVLTLSKRKECGISRNRLEEIEIEIAKEIEPALRRAINDDSIQFHKVFVARKARARKSDD